MYNKGNAISLPRNVPGLCKIAKDYANSLQNYANSAPDYAKSHKIMQIRPKLCKMLKNYATRENALCCIFVVFYVLCRFYVIFVLISWIWLIFAFLQKIFHVFSLKNTKLLEISSILHNRLCKFVIWAKK